MDIRKSLNCIKKYAKDYTLCCELLNNHKYEELHEILDSIITKEGKEQKLNKEELHDLFETVNNVDYIVREINIPCNDIYEEYPDNLFFPEDEDMLRIINSVNFEEDEEF
jgi:hypothetical protein